MKHIILLSALFVCIALVACQEPIQDLTLGQLVMVRDVGKNDVMYFKVLVQNTPAQVNYTSPSVVFTIFSISSNVGALYASTTEKYPSTNTSQWSDTFPMKSSDNTDFWIPSFATDQPSQTFYFAVYCTNSKASLLTIEVQVPQNFTQFQIEENKYEITTTVGAYERKWYYMDQSNSDFFVQMELCNLDQMLINFQVKQPDADSELSESECIDHPDIVPLGTSVGTFGPNTRFNLSYTVCPRVMILAHKSSTQVYYYSVYGQRPTTDTDVSRFRLTLVRNTAPRLNDNYLRESEVLPLRIGDDLLLSFVPGSALAKNYSLFTSLNHGNFTKEQVPDITTTVNKMNLMNSACFLTNYASAFSYAPTRDIESGSDRVSYKVLTNLYRNQKYFQDNTTFEVNIMANYEGYSLMYRATIIPTETTGWTFQMIFGIWPVSAIAICVTLSIIILTLLLVIMYLVLVKHRKRNVYESVH
jgi:hypothetical protein